MKTGERYYNCTRPTQIVQLVQADKQNVIYEVQQGNIDNPIKTFKCSKKRFKNIYIKIEL